MAPTPARGPDYSNRAGRRMNRSMKRTQLLLMTIAACGGKAGAPPPANSGGAGGLPAAALEAWAGAMHAGQVFAFREDIDPSADVKAGEAMSIEATVTEVTEVGDARLISLRWTMDGESAGNGLPGAILVGPRGVKFGSDRADVEASPADAPTWPAAVAAADLPDGHYIHAGALAGELCYGEGPTPDAGDCEDVCFAELCVHPRHGLTGGSGTWWPNYGIFIRSDLSK